MYKQLFMKFEMLPLKTITNITTACKTIHLFTVQKAV
jgi:hypothetical protein